MSPILTHNHDISSHIMSPYMSLTQTKGLLNGPGQNNCFLNSAVQVLWHLDIFRRGFRELSGHACMMDSCIFCALKELFTQFQYSHESALPPDALRRALAETFVNQQRFQLGFMDDAAECFENILMRIHFHIANGESEDMCNAPHCIPHQKFAMTLVEQGVCHACGATSEPLPFTQMVHYISSSALCAQSKINREERGAGNCSEQFGQLLRKAGGLGEIRDCPSICGAKIQIHRTLMNHPEIVSIGIVWDSERPNLEHIMDVFQTIGTTIRLQDVFHSVIDDRWASSTTHQLVGVVTYYGKHYSTFFFHTKLRVWIYFDDAAVREIGPHWEQVVEKCRRGHFQPLLLLYANPYGLPVATESAQKTVTYVPGHRCEDHQGRGYGLFNSILSGGGGMVMQRRAVTPNPEFHQDPSMDLQPRRAITPNAELHHWEFQGNNFVQKKNSNYNLPLRHQVDSDAGYSSSDRIPMVPNGPHAMNGHYGHNLLHSHHGVNQLKARQSAYGTDSTTPYSADLIQKLTMDGLRQSSKDGAYDQRGPLRTNGYFNNCDVPDAHLKGVRLPSNAFVYQQQNAGNSALLNQNNAENIYISRKAVESVLNYQKLQRHRHPGGNYNGCAAGNRNSNSSLESFENALRIRGQMNGAAFPYEGNPEPQLDLVAQMISNLPRSRDSGNWSGDRNSASSASSASMENPYCIMAGNKRQVAGPQCYRYSSNKGPTENGHRAPYDAGYDSFSLSSNDSFPMGQHGHPKHNQQLAQIPENVLDPSAKVAQNHQVEFIDECQSLCTEADKFLEKSMERENTGDLDGAISLCNGAAAKARAAMDAPYSNPQILAFARMKHNSCIMRARSLHRRMLVRQDSINSHGSSSTSTENDSPRRSDGDGAAAGGVIHHSRQSSRDSIRSRRESTGNHSRQSSRDAGNHSRQGSRDATHSRQNSQDAAEKKRIELYGTLPKKSSKKKPERTRTGSIRLKDEHALYGQRADSSFELHPGTTLLTESDLCARLRAKDMKTVEPAGPPKVHRGNEPTVRCDWSPPTTDYVSEWENTRKPNLQRANSIPPNFQQDYVNSHSCSDLTASKGRDDTPKSNTAGGKLGKKQHKIRRKLLMGGLIRRKNRSMPDLREGQDPSPSPEDSQRAFDDYSLRKSEQSLETLADRGLTPRNPNNLNLSHQNLYNDSACQRLYSSHGKIPPPPPVRTTSQLTTRSQSHGNLICTQQQPTDFGNDFAPNEPRVAYSAPPPPPFGHSATMTPLPERRTPAAVGSEGLPQHLHSLRAASHKVPQQPELPCPVNKMTIQADVHHERTPSDNIRPVCLVRRPSMNGGAANRDIQHRSNPPPPPRSEPRTAAVPQTVSFPYPPPFAGQMAQRQNSPVASQQQIPSENTETKDEDEPSPGGLLAELRMKRQQILENSAAKAACEPKQPELKSNGGTGDNWLRELQAKQQQMRNKKSDGPTVMAKTEVPAIKDTFPVPPTFHSQDDLKKLTMKPLATCSGLGKVPVLDTTTSTIPSIQVKAETERAIDYKPKSVRDLANRFEKILLSPPPLSASASTPPPVGGMGLLPEKQQEFKTVASSAANHPSGTRQDDIRLSPMAGDCSVGMPNHRLQQTKLLESADGVDGFPKVNCGAFAANGSPDSPALKAAMYNTNRAYDNRYSTEQRGNPVLKNGASYVQPPKDPRMDSCSPQLMGNNVSTYPMHCNRSSVPTNGASTPNDWHFPPELTTLDHRPPSTYQNSADINHIGPSNPRGEPFYNHHQNGTYSDTLRTASISAFSQNYYNGSAPNGYSGSSLLSGGTMKKMDPRPADGGFQREFQPHIQNGSPLGSAVIGPNVNAGMDGMRCGVPAYTDRMLPNYTPPPPVGPRTPVNAKANVASQRAVPMELNGLPSQLVQWQVPMNAVQSNASMKSEKDGLKKKKGKKSVTFSDQIALVACAEDNDTVSIPNPLLEKVLLKSAITSNLAATKTVVNPMFTNAQRANEHASGHNRDAMKCAADPLSSSMYPPHSNLPPAINGFNANGSTQMPPYPNHTTTSNPKSNGSKVPCYLCGKKTVVPPIIYCMDCDFYMSRFKPKK